MPSLLLRTALCALLLLSNMADAAETADPFDTYALLPQQSSASITGNPCIQPQTALNLLDVVNLALCRNPQTRTAWANSRVQAAQFGVAKSGYLPSLALTDTASHILAGGGNDQNTASATLSYLLYDFGARSANLENARQLLAAASATQDSTVQAVFLAAAQAYYQAQSGRAALDAAFESEQVAKESFAAAEARYKAGSATPADKLQAQTAYSQATLNRISAEGDLKIAQGTLANILGVDASQNILLAPANTFAAPDNFEANVNALIEQARLHRPDLQAATAQVKAAEASTDAARAAGRPSIALTAGANQLNSNGFSSNNSQIGITLNIPIFSGYATTYRVRAAEAQAEAKTSQLEQLRLQVALDVWSAYQRLTTATQSLRTSSDLLSSAEQSERVVLGRYKAGVGSVLDVLNAQSALASARQQRIQSLLNWNISRATLAQAMGNLDAELLQTLPDAGSRKPDENLPRNHP